MVSTSDSPPAEKSRHVLYKTLLIINLVIMLFPPIPLIMADGDMASALIYMLGSPAVLIVSVFILYGIVKRDEKEDIQ